MTDVKSFVTVVPGRICPGVLAGHAVVSGPSGRRPALDVSEDERRRRSFRNKLLRFGGFQSGRFLKERLVGGQSVVVGLSEAAGNDGKL
jgi:hypothetical protein